MGRRIKLTNATKTVTRGHGDGETRGNTNFSYVTLRMALTNNYIEMIIWMNG
jgi:hypothetical protein